MLAKSPKFYLFQNLKYMTLLIKVTIMIFVFILLHASLPSITKENQELAAEAMRRGKMLKSSDQKPIMTPGNYFFNGISFTLTKPIIAESTDMLRSYSIDSKRNVAALFQKNETKNSILADPSTNSFIEIGNSIESSNDVFIYEARKTDVFSFMKNLKIFSSETDICRKDSKDLNLAICRAWLSYNWPTPKEGENPLDLDPIPKEEAGGSIQTKIGAYAHILGAFKFAINGISDFSFDYMLEAGAVYGAGLKFLGDIQNKNFEYGEKCVSLYKMTYTLFGVTMKAEFNGCGKVQIDEVNTSTPKGVDYYRRNSVSIKKTGHISRSGPSSEPFEFSVQPSETSKVKNDEMFGPDANIKLEGRPTLKLYAEFAFDLSSNVKGSLDVGAKLASRWKFASDAEHCTSPYLYGNADFTLDGFIETSKIVVKDFELLPSFKFNYPLYQTATPKFCLSSPTNSQEGFSSLINPTQQPAVIIRPYLARVGNAADALFSVRMDVIDNSKVVKSLQLQSLNFSDTQTEKELSRIVVLQGVSSMAQVQISAVKYNTFFDDYFTFQETIPLNVDSDKELCGSNGNNKTTICIKTEVSRAADVELSKEFQGEDLKYVSFKNSRANDIYGLITHGADESYEVNKGEIFDDTALEGSDIQSMTYTSKKALNLKLENLYFTCGLSSEAFDVSLWFYRCSKDQCIPIGQMLSTNAFRNMNNTAESMNITDPKLPFTVSDDSSLKVTLSVNTMMWETRKEWTISKFDQPITASIEGGKYSITLSFEQYEPTVLFSVKGLSSGYRGIVSRVLPENTQLAKDEQYGILSVDTEDNYAILSVASDINILSSSVTRLDESSVVTKMSDTKLVPFRRSTSEAGDFKYAKLGSFNTDSDPFCAISHPKYAKGIGCIDTEENTHYYQAVSSYKFTTKKEIVKAKWCLNKFSSETAPFGTEVTFMNTHIKMGTNAIITIPSDLTRQIADVPDAKIVVEYGSNARGVRFDTVNFSYVGNELKPKNLTYTITALCSDIQSDYCESTLTAGSSKAYIIEGPSYIDDGPRGFINNLAPGNSVVTSTGITEVIELVPGKLRFDKSSSDGKTTISAFVGSMHIPFSSKFVTDPEAVLSALGCVKPDNGYQPGDAMMHKNGSITVKSSLIKNEPSAASIDVPEHYYKGYGSNNIVLIVSITISCLVVVVVVIIVFVCCSRRRAKKLQFSTMDSKLITNI